MVEFDERQLLHAHLFFTAFVLVATSVWVVSIPDGAGNFYPIPTSETKMWFVRRALETRWFGLVVLTAFVAALVGAFRKRYAPIVLHRICWIALAVQCVWFGLCMFILWEPMMVVFEPLLNPSRTILD
ncbi:MAG: hypothetical protein ICCCNLDF_01677 [Planctomycetes bacterium]|nr:hypothetical protein [Planctomycetota bacterium]